MLVGTVIGVLIIPGLYYLFGQIDGGRKLLKDESVQPLSERLHHESEHRDPGPAAGRPHPH
jgi:HAE1 family hydrophobic/amphiphilic exporter-1